MQKLKPSNTEIDEKYLEDLLKLKMIFINKKYRYFPQNNIEILLKSINHMILFYLKNNNNKFSKLEQTILNYEKCNRTNKIKIKKLNQEIVNEKNKNLKLESTLKNISNKNLKLEETIKNLKNSIYKEKEKFTTIFNKNKKNEFNLDQIKKAKVNLENEKKKIQNNIDNFKKDFSNLKTKSIQDLTTIKNEKNNVKNELKKKNSECNNIKDELTNLKEKLKSINLKNADLKQLHSKLEREKRIINDEKETILANLEFKNDQRKEISKQILIKYVLTLLLKNKEQKKNTRLNRRIERFEVDDFSVIDN